MNLAALREELDYLRSARSQTYRVLLAAVPEKNLPAVAGIVDDQIIQRLAEHTQASEPYFQLVEVLETLIQHIAARISGNEEAAVESSLNAVSHILNQSHDVFSSPLDEDTHARLTKNLSKSLVKSHDNQLKLCEKNIRNIERDLKNIPQKAQSALETTDEIRQRSETYLETLNEQRVLLQHIHEEDMAMVKALKASQEYRPLDVGMLQSCLERVEHALSA